MASDTNDRIPSATVSTNPAPVAQSAIASTTAAAAAALPAAPASVVKNPELGASFLSTMFMTYLHPMLLLGASRPLEQSDLGNVMPSDAAANLAEKFSGHWIAELAAAKQGKAREPSLATALRRTLGWEWLIAIAAFFASAGLNFLPPLILQQLVASLQGTGPLSTRDAWIDVVALFVVPFASAILQNYHNVVMARVGTNMRTCLTGAIYAKALVLRPSAEFTTGEVRGRKICHDTNRAQTCCLSHP